MSLNIDHTLDKIESTSGGITIPGPTVPSNSPGNVSRWVMDTALANATTYWTKIATFTNTLGSTNILGKKLIIQYASGIAGGGSKTTSTTEITLDIRDDGTNGLLAGSSGIFVHSTGLSVTHYGLMLVGSITLGQPIELWLQMGTTATQRKYSIYDVSSGALNGGGAGWTISYNHDSAWQAAPPTGAVTITSDWAGSGWVNITPQNGWVQYASTYATLRTKKTSIGEVYVEFRMSNGTTTNGTVIGTLPTGSWPATYNKVFPLIVPGGTPGTEPHLVIQTNGQMLIYNVGTGTNIASSFNFQPEA